MNSRAAAETDNLDYLKQSLSGFRMLKLAFALSPMDRIYLGDDDMKGDRWRGGIGAKVLWDMGCEDEGEDCKHCEKKESCIYFKCFGNNEGRIPPRPYVLHPALDMKSAYIRGEKFQLDLFLIGNAANQIYRFIKVIERLGMQGIGGGRGKFFVVDVTTSEIEFSRMSNEKAKSREHLLELLTPVKIKEKGAGLYYKGLSFEKFFKLLIKRVLNLNNLYCDGILFDKEQIEHIKSCLISLAQQIRMESHTEWNDYERNSSRQRKSIKMGGQVGIFITSGNLDPFYPYLKLGEIIGVGQHTTSGFGRYKIIENTAREM